MKKWQDTILTLEQIDKAIQEGYRWNNLKDKSLLSVQAKATWDIAFKAGIKEVVEYKCERCSTPNFVHLVIPLKQFEEWGIK